ncbi:MAG: caspase family protein, partial [Brevinema sp.]
MQLLIGIGTYKSDSGWKRINGDADVSLLKPQFEKQGFVVATLVNEKATKLNIIAALTRLKKECQLGDRVYFHFSGHGQPMTDANGDEENGYDESMVPYDAGRFYQKG